MNEHNKRIGERIRTLRLSKNITQSELCADFITRNMLSLIENGAASPSLATLTELARRLDVPVGFFFADSDKETARFSKMGMIDRLQTLYLSSEYAACLEACSALSSPDDEIALLSLRCSFALAKSAFDSCALASASAYLERAAQFAAATVYANPAVLPTIRCLRMLIQAAGQEEIPKSLAAELTAESTLIPAEFTVYVRALCALDEGDTKTALTLYESGLIRSGVYLDFLNAWILFINGDTEKAFPILKKVLLSGSTGFFTRYHVLTALESCARVAGDFKTAYQYSAQKVRLLENYAK